MTQTAKLGLLFPGQGAQYVGMGRELCEQYAEAREVFAQADSVLGFSLQQIVFEGPEEVLRQTQYTQPAIFVTSLAAFRVFASRVPLNAAACCCAGHSLGEYSALGAADVFSLEDGLKLVRARGEFIRIASEKNPGTMAAILGLERDKVREICSQAASPGACEAVNFNSPGQVVIAGTAPAVQKAIDLSQAAGASKSVALNVSGPFHSSLMTPAAEMMKEELAKYRFSAPRFPVIMNCDARPASREQEIKDRLYRQINHPVLWEETVQEMIRMGAQLFIEIGPGRVLSGLMRRIDKTKKVTNVEDTKTLEKTAEQFAPAV